MKVYLEFESGEEALAYRRVHGTGGWVFVSENGPSYIFPHGMTPSQVMLHPLVKGRNGRLF